MGGVAELLLAYDDPSQEAMGGMLLGERNPAEHLHRTVCDLACGARDNVSVVVIEYAGP